jgi:hypothetical protein
MPQSDNFKNFLQESNISSIDDRIIAAIRFFTINCNKKPSVVVIHANDMEKMRRYTSLSPKDTLIISGIPVIRALDVEEGFPMVY